MNIFRVLASAPRISFSEEFASAILGWLLHPQMEHGLGDEFLSRFCRAIIRNASSSQAKDAINRSLGKPLVQLRSQSNERKFEMHLEKSVNTAVIDIVVRIDDAWLLIENKIRITSCSENQLKREYNGLRTELDAAYKDGNRQRIVVVYLVPYDDERCRKEFNSLVEMSPEDCKVFVTWEPAADDDPQETPSFVDLVRAILNDELSGAIDPLQDDCRHTLKALMAFVVDGFEGYKYDPEIRQGGDNPLTEERLQADQLILRESGFVGISGGLNGLIALPRETIESRPYQYTTQDMTGRPHWIPLSVFQTMYRWLCEDIKEEDFLWDFPRLAADVLLKIARSHQNSVYIGIRGGLSSLNRMSRDEIAAKRWCIKMHKLNNNYVSGEEYVSSLSNVGLE